MISSIIARHRKKFMSFMSVGALVFLLSNLLLFGLVSFGASRWVAYMVQQPICTLTNYALNRHFTWKTRQTSAVRSLATFLAVRVFTTVAKLGLFLLMTYQLHIHYMVSNIMLIAMFGLVNYSLSDKLTFRDRGHETPAAEYSPVAA